MNRDELIAKAAKAISDKSWSGFDEGETFAEAYARIAFDVFEEAHAPTDDGWEEWTATLEALLADVYTILKPLAERGTHGGNSPILKAYALLNAQEFTRHTVVGEPEPRSEHPCGDWPAPCNCDDPETHDKAIARTDGSEDHATF